MQAVVVSESDRKDESVLWLLTIRIHHVIKAAIACTSAATSASASAPAAGTAVRLTTSTGATQRSQYPLMKEYTLNHDMKASVVQGIFLN